MKTEIEQRAAVITEAMQWMRTPYHNGAAVKGVGADCARFPLAVYTAVGVLPETEIGSYSSQWHLHRSEELYLDWLLKLGAAEIAAKDTQPGDFVVWKFGRTFSHGGIVIGPHLVIHAYAKAEKVTVDDYGQHSDLKDRPARFFSPWGATDGRG